MAHATYAKLTASFASLILNALYVPTVTTSSLMGGAKSNHFTACKSMPEVSLMMLLFVKNANMDIRYSLEIVIHAVKVFIM